MVNMVAAGEASGSLETAMERVATQLEKSHKTQAMVKKAMIYPIAVCIVAIIVTIVMLVKVISLYEDMFMPDRRRTSLDYKVLCEFESWHNQLLVYHCAGYCSYCICNQSVC